MNRSIEELKIRAKRFHKSINAGEPAALTRLRKLRSSDLEIRRKTCLNGLAMEMGFREWSHAKSVLSGENWQESNKGTLWYSKRCVALLNIWFADYKEAKRYLMENPEYFLLPYKNQFIVVDDNFLKMIDLWEGCQDEWTILGHDLIDGFGSPEWHHLVWKRISSLRVA